MVYVSDAACVFVDCAGDSFAASVFVYLYLHDLSGVDV
nr:MAG TPA: hypothetical protein [Caudoviricetes sp.]